MTVREIGEAAGWAGDTCPQPSELPYDVRAPYGHRRCADYLRRGWIYGVQCRTRYDAARAAKRCAREEAPRWAA